jgi:hypothetical protein
MSYKLLSEYFSDDQKRRSTVSQDLTTRQFRVAVISDTGTAFSSMFETEDQAEQFAEEWVRPQ